MNRIITFLIIINIAFVAQGQNTYSIVFTAPATNDYPSEMVENQLGDLFITGSQYDYTSVRRAVVWKVSSIGDTLTKAFHFGDTSSTLYTILLNNDTTVSVFGTIDSDQNSPNSSLLVLKLDTSLNVINSKIINIPGLNKLFIERSYSTPANYFLAGKGTDYSNISKTVLIKLDSQYNLISHQCFFENENYNGAIQDLLMSNDQTLLYVFARNVVKSVAMLQLIITDTAFNIVSIKPFPRNQFPGYLSSEFSNSVTAKLLPNDDFIIGGTYYLYGLNQGIQIDIGFSIFDTSMAYQPMKVYGKVDTTENGGFLQCIDIRSDLCK